MQKRIIIRVVLPVIALLAINYAFFYPVFQGKVLEQDDMIQGQMINKQGDDFYEKNKKPLLWTDALFSGMPAIQVGLRYPNNLLTYVHKSMGAVLGKPSHIYIIALLMIGFFFTLYSQKVNPWLAFAGAIAFGFSTFFIVSFGAGHNAKVRTAAYIAPMIAGILLAYRGKRWLGFSIVAGMMGLSIFSNHLQITYYSAMTIGLLVIVEGVFAIRDKAIKPWLITTAGLALAALIGVGPNVSRLMTNYDYAKETMRGGISELTKKQETSSGGLEYDYAMSWSYAPIETFNLIYTNFNGGGSNQDYSNTMIYEQYFNNIKSSMVQQGYPSKQAERQANRTIASLFYWGEQQMVGGGYYVGAVVFFLFVLAMFTLGTRERVWIALSIVFALFLSWGYHLEGFSRFMFNHFPLYNKFRVPSMALVSVFVLMPLAGWLALQKVYEGNISAKVLQKQIRNTLLVTGGLSLFFILFSGMFDFIAPNDDNLAKQGVDLDLLREDRQSLLVNSALKTLIFCALTAGLLFAYVRQIIKPRIMIVALVALVMIDQLPFVRQHLSLDKFMPKREYEAMFKPNPEDQQIMQLGEGEKYRVFNTTRGLTGDAFTSYFHHSISGYHGAKLARYQDLIEFQLSQQNMEVINMLNTRFFMVQGEGGRKAVQTNPGACGNAWLADSIIIVPNADAEMEALSDFRGCKDVVVDERYSDYLKGVSINSGTVTLDAFDNPMHLEYTVNNNGNSDALAVFSEIYYKGGGNDWVAKINGEDVEHIRVNYLLRGLKVPPGEHKVEFIFAPPSFYVGERFALAFSILFFGFIGFGVYRHAKS
ncbi:MAG: YfhO family protein [Cryomorphaceae bacterium]|nr:YfhO family protein [Cryomorphaceae bacterium]